MPFSSSSVTDVELFVFCTVYTLQGRAGAQLKLHWLSSPRTFLLVAKPTAAVKPAVSAVIAWLLQRGLTVYLEPRLHAEIAADELEKAAESSSEVADKSEIVRSASGGSTSGASHKRIQTARDSYRGSGGPVTKRGQLLTWTPEQAAADNVPADHVPRATAEKLDLVVTLGGDGTVLWMGTLLGKGPVPPVIPFALGSLGFMTPFQLEAMPEVLSQVHSPYECVLHAALVTFFSESLSSLCT